MDRARRSLALLLVAALMALGGAKAAMAQQAAPVPKAVSVQRALSDVRRVSRGSRAPDAPLRERILRFDVTAEIGPDASLTVREDLEFIASGIKVKRGLVRAIPVRYTTEEGRTVEVGLEVLSTSLDGDSLKWKESDEGRARLIRIGDPSRVLSHGTHRLSLVYRTTKQLGFFDTHDELYWNVTGNEWDMPIQSASFKLRLPGMAFGEGFSAVEWYTGRFGSTDTSGARETADRTTMTTRALQPGQGLTVVYSWPRGVVLPPEKSALERLDDFAWRNGSAIHTWLSGLGAAVAAVLLGVCGVRAFSNHTGETAPAPLFHEPEGLTPAQARLITAGRVDTQALSAEIIKLAVQGWLKIAGSKKEGYRLEKTDRAGSPDDRVQQNLLETLFPFNETRLRLKNSQHERFQAAETVLKGSADAKAFYDNASAPLWWAFAALLAGSAGASAFSIVTDTGTADQATGGLFAALVSYFALSASVRSVGSASGGLFKMLGGFFGFLLPAGVWGFALLSERPWCAVYAIPAAVCALIGLSLRRRLRRWTPQGRKKLEQAQGLEMFIRAAEKDRLELLNAPDDTPELFEDLLPYAVALDCVKNWTRRFSKVLEEASYQPRWCDMPLHHGAYWSADDLTSGISNVTGGFSSSLSSASTPPGSSSGSSSFGGGGSSGGGGGGGGGHGW